MSWYTPEEKRESIRKAQEALASANATLQDAALFQRATTPMGFICKTKDDALVEPRESVRSARSARSTEAAESSKTSAVAREAECEMTDDLREVLVGIIVELRRERRAEIQEKVDPLERELKLLRHEFVILREDVALSRKLHDLHDEIAEARKQVPKLPAIVDQFDARQCDLEAEQARLERELAKTKDRLGKVRVNQSITDYNLKEMRKQMDVSAGASVELEFESRSAHFQMKATHPDAARALKEFAGQIIDGQRDGTLWLPGRAGNA
jgi:chromosome segregation ATPase